MRIGSFDFAYFNNIMGYGSVHICLVGLARGGVMGLLVLPGKEVQQMWVFFKIGVHIGKMKKAEGLKRCFNMLHIWAFQLPPYL